MKSGGKQTDMVPMALSMATIKQKVADTWSLWFGPSKPIAAVLTPQMAEDSGARGRAWDFPTGVNMRYVPRSEGDSRISFADLRGLAESYDLVRGVIEATKDELETLEFVIRPKDQTIHPDDDPRCKVITDFLMFPDKIMTWKQWLRVLLEELFVIDAPVIYPRMTKGGELYSLEIIAGDTIKIVVDETGRRPLPPSPAYQQIIKGVPATEYTANELIYHARNLRASRLYGLSPVEQVIITVNIAIRRQLHQLNYYSEGTVPDAIMGCPKEWNPDQIHAFQDYWDSLLTDNLAERRKVRFVPDGVTFHETKTAGLKDDYDEWLARIICFFFNQPPTPFIKQMNRSTSENSAEQAKEQGSKVVAKWLEDLMTNRIIRTFFKAPDLEFAYKIEEDIDPLIQAQVDQIYLQEYVISPNEVRERKGLEGPAPTKPLLPMQGQPTVTGDSTDDDTGGMGSGGGNTLQSGKKGSGGASGKNTAQSVTDSTGKAADTKSQKSAMGGNAKGGGKGAQVNKIDTSEVTRAKKKTVIHIDRDRDEIKTIRSEIEDTVDDFFDGEAPLIAKEINEGLSAGEKIDAILERLDFSRWSNLIAPMTDKLKDAFNDGGDAGFFQISIAPGKEMTDLVNQQAVNYAESRAAELVGMKNIGTKENPNWVTNPNSEWAITDSTRDMIRSTVTDAEQEGWSNQRLATALRESEGFDQDRAMMIARTETAFADSKGNMAAYRASGVVTGKEWIVANEGDEKVCDECEINGDDGAIGLDELFSSGDDCPPAHPDCRCSCSPRVMDKEETDVGDEEE